MIGAAEPEALARLTEAEREAARAGLGREPNPLEWTLLASLWSEHTSYKHSRHLLAQLPHGGRAVVSGPGGNAGVVRVMGHRVAFKVESHNHPSAVEPVQGAATGVGGILRDVMAMGTRPVAVLDGLCAGPPEEAPERRLLAGVVEGISRYGNAVGVPTVGGFLRLDPGYRGVPLVNVMAVGVAPPGRPLPRGEGAPGDVLLLLGAATGPDGLGGAAFSSAVREAEQAGRAAVQVGDPFRGRLLLEACDRLARHPAVRFLQDLGATGLAGAAAETASTLGLGLELDLDAVPVRSRLEPWVVLLSETQERMLAVVRGHEEAAVEALLQELRAQGLTAARVGRFGPPPGRLRVTVGGRVWADLPADLVTRGVPVPATRPPAAQPSPPVQGRAAGPFGVADLEAAVQRRQEAAGASRAPLYEAFDSTVGTRTVVGPGDEAAVLRLGVAPEEGAVAVVLVGRSPLPGEDAAGAAARAVRVAFHRLAAMGARPLALTDGLNLPSPETPEGGRALALAAAGVGAAARALGLPVVSGNVSLYNEGPRGAVPPTVAIGMVGSLPLPRRGGGRGLQAPGLRLGLLGEGTGPGAVGAAGRARRGGAPDPVPSGPARGERRAAAACRVAVRRGLARAAVALDEEGLWDAALRAILADLQPPGPAGAARGVRLTAPAGRDPVAWALCGGIGRYLLAVEPSAWEAVRRLAGRLGCGLEPAGETLARPELVLEPAGGTAWVRIPLEEVAQRHRRALREAMGWR